MRHRPDPGTRLAGRERGPAAADPEPALAAFLDRLADAVQGEPRDVALLVEPSGERLRRWAATRPGTALHVVPPEQSWARLARVACLLAGAGGTSVAELCRALDGHGDTSPVSWAPTRTSFTGCLHSTGV